MPGLQAESIQWIGVAALAVILCGLFNKNHSGVTRYWAARRIKRAAGSYLELKTRNYDIKYTVYDNEHIAEIANVAEVAYDLVGNFFGGKPERKIPLMVYEDSTSLASSFGWERDQKAAGVYWKGTICILSPRFYVKNTEQLTKKFLTQGPLVHELAHLWVDDMTRGNCPRWWTEGIAQYAERELTGFIFGNPFTEKREFTYYTLAELENAFDNLDKSIAYWESLRFVDFMVQKYGAGCMFAIMKALRRNGKIFQAIEEVTDMKYNVFQQLFYQDLEINRREV
ncbi:MAG: hypothetical protein LBR98_00775 [Syntrophomonadaceae bacterium]|nr:hypothetical protein [Syntrophomonadaceae bacterium]